MKNRRRLGMVHARAGAVIFAAVSAPLAVLLAACATDEGAGSSADAAAALPSVDASVDGQDASDEADAAPCTDCEWYPAECTDDALCSAGLFAQQPSEDTLDLRTQVMAFAGRSADDLWLVGTVGGVAHFDGESWKRSRTDTQQSLYGIWLLPDAEVAFDDPRRLYTRGLDTDADASTGGWSFRGAATVPPGWTGDIRVEVTYAHADAPSLWIGSTSTGSFVGGLWRMRYDADSGTFSVVATAQKAYAAGVPCREIYGVHGLSPNEIWAVGPEGAAIRVTDAESDAPTLTGFNTLTTYALEDVWAAASDDVWAVGASGTVRRYRGDPRFWEIYEDMPTKEHLRAIAGSSPTDIWVAGDEGTVFHYDGTAWQRVKVAGLGARRPRLEKIVIPSPGKVWIAGQGVLVSLGGKP